MGGASIEVSHFYVDNVVLLFDWSLENARCIVRFMVIGD